MGKSLQANPSRGKHNPPEKRRTAHRGVGYIAFPKVKIMNQISLENNVS
jgi:hypothetical protein